MSSAPTRARLKHSLHTARRVAQTPVTFANWPHLLGGLGAAAFDRGPRELEFITRRGVRIACPNVPGARLAVYEQFAEDCYGLAKFLAPLARQPLHVLDIGAHVGAFALNVASLHPTAHVECYEPSPQSARFLRRNIERNGLSTRVVAHESALADREGTATLDDNEGGSVHNGLVRGDERLVADAEAWERRRTITVSTTTLDAAVAASPAPPNVVKIDCEGGEYALVPASSPHSWAAVQRVALEYHPVRGESWDSLRAWFAGIGLHVVRHTRIAPGLGSAWLVRGGAGGR